MSGISGSMSLSVYLSTVKNEQAQVARNVSSDTTLEATVAGFRKAAPTLTTPSAILKNYGALQVLTGAYNMSGQISRTAVLSDLMTQSPESTGSLVQQTANTDYLHFARATNDRSSQTAALGPAGTLSLVTGGASASSVTMQNTAWSLASTAQTAAAPGVQWSFVLNDGSAAGSVAAALTSAAAATDSTATYSVSSTGTVSGSPGAPAVTSTTDSAGNTVYSLALATDASGNVVKRADIVSVAVAAGTGSDAVAAQTGALQGAIKAAGFDATLSGTSLTVIDPAGTGTNSLARSYGSAIATATASTVDASGRLVLGDAGKTLSAGQVLTDGTTEIGTVKSVDSFGNVTLTATAAAATKIQAGDTIEVATGLGFANVGTKVTSVGATGAGSKLLALGAAGASLTPGQIVTSGGVTIGTVGSVNASGTVTLLAGLATELPVNAPLVVLPAVSGGSTAALTDAANVDGIVSSYETNAYETKMGQQYAGMDDALYYTRTMGSITSISQLMSNAKLLSVVTTSLGMGSYFGALDYDQQVSILTAKVDIKSMTSKAGIQKTAEQYLISEAATQSTQKTGLVALLAGQSTDDTDLFSLIVGATAPNATSSSSDPLLGLFA